MSSLFWVNPLFFIHLFCFVDDKWQFRNATDAYLFLASLDCCEVVRNPRCKEAKRGFLPWCIRVVQSDGLDEYDLGGSIVYCCQIVLDLMCYGPPYIIWGIHIPFLTYGVDTVSEVFWEPERSLCGIALFHEFSFNVVNILFDLKDGSVADRECDWNVL